MTRFLAYIGPADTLDLRARMREQFGLDGDNAEKFIWHTPTNAAVHPDERGTVVEVTNEQSEELLTFPGHTFVEVPEDRAKLFIRTQAQRRSIRQERDKLYAQHGQPQAEAPQRTLHPALAEGMGVPAAPQIAPMAPRDPETIRAEVNAETKALKKQQAKED